MIRLTELTKKFADKTAVDRLSLEVEGGFVCITGRSGSGKSTLLKMMGLMLPPTSGQVTFDGADLWAAPEAERNRARNTLLGFVFQDYALEPHYTVAENVELPLLIAGRARAERRARVAECLAFVGLSGLERQRAGTLSGGEQQRTAIARAIANRPAFLLADEPCGNLDKENGDRVVELFRSLVREGTSVIMVTHNEEDARKTDRVIRLLDGRVCGDERL